MTIEFLHHDAGITVEWLCDNYIKKLPEIENIILNNICMYDRSPHNDLSEDNWPLHMHAWLMSSVEHFMWVRSYYKNLTLKYSDLIGQEYRGWKFEMVMRIHTKDYPKVPWQDPVIDAPPDCIGDSLWATSRKLYKRVRMIRPINYIKTRRPYWF